MRAGNGLLGSLLWRHDDPHVPPRVFHLVPSLRTLRSSSTRNSFAWSVRAFADSPAAACRHPAVRSSQCASPRRRERSPFVPENAPLHQRTLESRTMIAKNGPRARESLCTVRATISFPETGLAVNEHCKPSRRANLHNSHHVCMGLSAHQIARRPVSSATYLQHNQLPAHLALLPSASPRSNNARSTGPFSGFAMTRTLRLDRRTPSLRCLFRLMMIVARLPIRAQAGTAGPIHSCRQFHIRQSVYRRVAARTLASASSAFRVKHSFSPALQQVLIALRRSLLLNDQSRSLRSRKIHSTSARPLLVTIR